VDEFQAEAGALRREIDTLKGDISVQLDVLATELTKATEQVPDLSVPAIRTCLHLSILSIPV
jgi:hypothetical protein